MQDLTFDALPSADGTFYDGKVYLVAENLFTSRQVQKVMAHECVLHHGLEQMLGAYGFAKLHHGIQSLKAQGDATITGLAGEILRSYGELPAEIETREIVAWAGERCLDAQGEIRVEHGFMKGVFAGVAGWLRDHGISVPFTNTQLQGILHKTGEWARVDRGDRERSPGRAEQGDVQSGVERAGRFIGRILGIENGIATQRVNRQGDTALHWVADLSAAVAVGDVADIRYQDGRGHVQSAAREIAR